MSAIIKSLGARRIFNILGEEAFEINAPATDGSWRALVLLGAGRGLEEGEPYPKGALSEVVKRIKETIALEQLYSTNSYELRRYLGKR